MPPPSPGAVHDGSRRASNSAVAWYAEGLSDPIGDRLQLFDTAGPGLELLRFHPRITTSPAFEGALRARVERLDGFRHPGIARIRRVTVLEDPRPQLALVSEYVPGERLSVVLRTARLAGLRAHGDAVVRLLRQVVPALVALHERTGAAHGALTPDRILVNRSRDLVVTEPVLGPALDALRLDPRVLWNELGICQAPSARSLGDPRTDIFQVAFLAAALLVGRPARPSEYPHDVAALVDEARAGLPESHADSLAVWLARALELQGPPFASSADACAALDDIACGDMDGWTTPLIGGGAGGDAAGRPGRVLFTGAAERRPPKMPAERLQRSRDRWRAVAAALACAVVIEGGWLAHLAWTPRTPIVQGLAEQTSPADPAPDAPRAPAVVATALTQTSGSPAAAGAAAARVPAAAGGTGWVRVDAALPIQVFANGRLIGTAAHARFRVAAGTHEITLVNDRHRFRSTEAVTIAAGQTVTLAPALAR